MIALAEFAEFVLFIAAAITGVCAVVTKQTSIGTADFAIEVAVAVICLIAALLLEVVQRKAREIGRS